MPHGHAREVAHERRIGGVHQRAFHAGSRDGVGAVQHVERNSRLGRGFQAVGHGGLVGVEPHADVLDVVHQRVEALQHFRRRPERASIEAVNLDARRGVGGILDSGAVFHSSEAVLGGEKRGHLDAGLFHEIHVAPAHAIQARLVRNQPYPLSAEKLEILIHQRIEASLRGGVARHLAARAGGEGVAVSGKRDVPHAHADARGHNGRDLGA